MGYILSGKRRWVIFYVLRKQTPPISVFQREINRLNRENGNRGFRENKEFCMQNTGQSHPLNENLKLPHGHYGHFAPAGFP